MSAAKTVREIKPNDVIYTPKLLAKNCIDLCDIKPNETVLDPCRGGGAFYDQIPNENKYYCEIDEEKDFFAWETKVDTIIGNPPYSMWDKWIDHTLKYCDKFCYIFGVYNFTPPRLQRILDGGFGVTKFTLAKVDWWFSPTYIIVCERNKESVCSVIRDRFLCDVCNKRCGRGVKGKSMNECGNQTK